MTQIGSDEADRWRAEAQRWEAEAGRLAVDNAALRGQVTELQGQVAALSERVVTLTGLLFGDSSEKQKHKGEAGPGEPAAGPQGHGDGGGQDGGGRRRRRGQQPGSRGHGRRDYSDLDTIEEVHDIAEGEGVCGCCGKAYVPFGEETSEQIDWQVRIVRIVHRRRRYRRACPVRCPGC